MNLLGVLKLEFVVPIREGTAFAHGEIEASGAVALVFEGAVADFADTMEEQRSRESVARLAFVETGVHGSKAGRSSSRG